MDVANTTSTVSTAALWVAVAAAVAAAVSAFFAAKNSIAARKAIEAQLVNDLLREYSSSEFLASAHAVTDWFSDPTRIKAALWAFTQNHRHEGSPAARVNEARRQLSHYYLRCWRYREAKYLSGRAFALVACKQSLTTVVLSYVWELEKALHEDNPRRTRDWPDRTREFNEIARHCHQTLGVKAPTSA